MATVPARAPLSRVAEHRFYVTAACLAAVIVVVGFSRTYFLKEVFHTPPLLPIIHLHGLVFSSWIVLFITQTWLVSAHRTRVHMRLGIAGFVLSCAMVVIGTTAAITVARLGHVRPGGPPPLFFLVVPIFDMAVFSTLIAAGFFLRRRPDYHKRVMLVATASIMTAAFGRIILITSGAANVNLALTFTDLLIVAAATYDALTHRRLHPAFVWSGALVLVAHPLRLVIGHTHAWMSFAQWLTR